MALARRTDLGPVADEVARLRGKIDTMQRRRADTDVIPVAGELSALFPDGGFRPGSTYALSTSTSLLLALFSTPSAAGSWCAVLGVPELGAEAAEGYGVALERLALVPYPGERWMSVAGALAEVVPLIAVRPPTRPHDAEIARLSARLRDRGSVLIILGEWSGADVSLRLGDAAWTGLGDGYGLLRSREVTVSSAARRFPRPRSVRVQLPGPGGGLAACTSRPGGSARPLTPDSFPSKAIPPVTATPAVALAPEPPIRPVAPASVNATAVHTALLSPPSHPSAMRPLNTVADVVDELARRRRDRDLAGGRSRHGARTGSETGSEAGARTDNGQRAEAEVGAGR